MISYEHVYFSYDKKNCILSDFSLKVNNGDRICLFGKSGRGKSTVLRMALGLIKPERGMFTVTGNAVPSAVFQEDRLIPWKNVLQNTAMFSDEETARSMLKGLGLGEALNMMPAELSGGMKRRTALARALCHPFDYLVLDEPFTGLDDATKKNCIDIINHSAAGKTILLASHDRNDAAALGARVLDMEGDVKIQ